MAQPSQFQSAAAHRNQVRRQGPAEGLHQRILGADGQYFHVRGGYALQSAADEVCRGGRGCGLWCADVCEHDLFCRIYRLFRGSRSGGELSLRRRESGGAEGTAEKEPGSDRRFLRGHAGPGGRAGQTSFFDFCGI